MAAAQIPRFAFEKFPGSVNTLSTQMKSVGEAMAIGRTFQVQRKCIRATQLADMFRHCWAWLCVSTCCLRGPLRMTCDMILHWGCCSCLCKSLSRTSITHMMYSMHKSVIHQTTRSRCCGTSANPALAKPALAYVSEI